jgi:DNA-directed RNA polymerase specialized sigma24 family protein
MCEMILAIAAASAVRGDEEVQAAQKAPRRPRSAVAIDFHAVLPQHYKIDGRLRNWGIWCNSTAAASSAPMFRLAAPTVSARRERQSNSTNVDRSDAVRIALAVTALPEKHAAALNWCYVKPVGPQRAASSIGVSVEGLAELLTQGRQMLVNRLGT